MRTTLKALVPTLLLSSVALAAHPAHTAGLLVRLDPSYVFWNLDAPHIQSQTDVPPGDVQAALVDQTPNAPGVALEVGFGILRHATLSAMVLGTGWDLGSSNRGGGGFVAARAAWHPLELIDALKDREYDAQLFFGAGYGVVGEQRAIDGLHLQFGIRAEYFVAPWFSVGPSLTFMSLKYHRYVIDWNNDVSENLPQGSGGGATVFGISFGFHGAEE